MRKLAEPPSEEHDVCHETVHNPIALIAQAPTSCCSPSSFSETGCQQAQQVDRAQNRRTTSGHGHQGLQEEAGHLRDARRAGLEAAEDALHAAPEAGAGQEQRRGTGHEHRSDDHGQPTSPLAFDAVVVDAAAHSASAGPEERASTGQQQEAGDDDQRDFDRRLRTSDDQPQVEMPEESGQTDRCQQRHPQAADERKRLHQGTAEGARCAHIDLGALREARRIAIPHSEEDNDGEPLKREREDQKPDPIGHRMPPVPWQGWVAVQESLLFVVLLAVVEHKARPLLGVAVA
mmetsp:Transcript_4299/g.16145  ORF Transcript_4299/g.16145 Transcript_4299/m.16145 type:complete len:290 (-) Transcript_4299:120-989(-)